MIPQPSTLQRVYGAEARAPSLGGGSGSGPGGGSGGGGQIFSIGKSKAKLFDEKNDTRITADRAREKDLRRLKRRRELAKKIEVSGSSSVSPRQFGDILDSMSQSSQLILPAAPTPGLLPAPKPKPTKAKKEEDTSPLGKVYCV